MLYDDNDDTAADDDNADGDDTAAADDDKESRRRHGESRQRRRSRHRRAAAIVRLRERLGVGLDSLPTVRFDSSKPKRRRPSHDNNGGGDDDDEGGSGSGSGLRRSGSSRLLRERQRECLTHGAFVGERDEFVECRAYCAVSDGVTYRYYDRLGTLLNGRRGRVDTYCLPTDAAVCNTSTSLTVYGGGWRCLPQMRAFAGQGGDMIVACDGRLLDRATGRVWRGRIDSTLALDSIDEPLQSRQQQPQQ